MLIVVRAGSIIPPLWSIIRGLGSYYTFGHSVRNLTRYKSVSIKWLSFHCIISMPATAYGQLSPTTTRVATEAWRNGPCGSRRDTECHAIAMIEIVAPGMPSWRDNANVLKGDVGHRGLGGPQNNAWAHLWAGNGDVAQREVAITAVVRRVAL